jgi:predicted MFS family arabinose efflux permease
MLVYTAIWIQNVSAAWLMTTLVASPLMVALVQTATSLPGFLFGLPGGILADIVNRKQFLLFTLSCLAATGLVLAAITNLSLITPLLLLLLTFLVGALFSLQTPSWFSTQVELVPLPLIPSALALGSVSFNTARAVGPAMAGLLIPLVGVDFVFVLVSACFLVAILCLISAVQGQSVTTNKDSDESPGEALRGLYRYSRYTPIIGRQIIRTFSFVFAASALWALLPLIAKQQLFKAEMYGYLVGSMGVGAVVGALMTSRLLSLLTGNSLALIGISLFMLATVLCTHVSMTWLLCLLLFVAGSGWQMASNFNLSTIQTSVAAWVRGRSLSVYLLAFQGALALGALFWGVVAEHWGVLVAMHASGGALLLAIGVSVWLPAQLGDASDVQLANREGVIDRPPDLGHDAAAFIVETVYLIAVDNQMEFEGLAKHSGMASCRDGALSWSLIPGETNRALFRLQLELSSWTAYQRMLSRKTQKDQCIEDRLYQLHAEGNRPPIHYYPR